MVRSPEITGLVAVIGMSLAINIAEAQDAIAQDDPIAHFSQQIRNRPDSPNRYVDRAKAYLRKGNADRAIADLTEAINLARRSGGYDPGSWYFLRGVTYSKKGNTDRAIADLTEAMRSRHLFVTAVPHTLDNPYGWPCPRGYSPKGTRLSSTLLLIRRH